MAWVYHCISSGSGIIAVKGEDGIQREDGTQRYLYFKESLVATFKAEGRATPGAKQGRRGGQASGLPIGRETLGYPPKLFRLLVLISRRARFARRQSSSSSEMAARQSILFFFCIGHVSFDLVGTKVRGRRSGRKCVMGGGCDFPLNAINSCAVSITDASSWHSTIFMESSSSGSIRIAVGYCSCGMVIQLLLCVWIESNEQSMFRAKCEAPASFFSADTHLGSEPVEGHGLFRTEERSPWKCSEHTNMFSLEYLYRAIRESKNRRFGS